MADPPLVPWSLGSHGKGAVLEDHELVLWTVDGVDGRPHHETALRALGRDDRTPVAFWVKPDGAVTTLVDRSFPPVEDLAGRLREADPELRLVSDEEWDLA
jgi:hypothetical protein